ncbi:VOC family protein [Microbacterium sp. HMH0099]|uniref:VOC family protein n=1 Tax=Microbacterium sp. HMH0099 TaxID=3414026 RepID=UPI003BF6D35B
MPADVVGSGLRPAATNSPAEVADFGAVHLEVTDLSRSTAFWTDVVGLTLRSETPEEVHLGTRSATLVTLHPGARTVFTRRHATGRAASPFTP